MRFLADSHVLVWWLSDPGRLSANARAAISNGANELLVSAASTWELHLKIAKGKLTMPANFMEILRLDGFADLHITSEHAEQAAKLPPHHSDPFDRMLIAQALAENLVLITRDAEIQNYGTPLLLA